ncbi:MAG: 4-hydroxy-tetrahydrodipicolinate synthase [Thermodesulfobacteriota bacterium]
MEATCYTAMITPFLNAEVDYEGLAALVDFQIQNGIHGILAVGTTGESPSLSWKEHLDVVAFIAKQTRSKCRCIAGTGSNNTQEALEASAHAVDVGVDALLLVDPYYNGPSSLEIRREYVEPIAEAFPKTTIIPYVIPGRTGTQLLPEDLALAYRRYPNVSTVKEATGNLDNMRKTRSCCGPEFRILSGDDSLTFEMMIDARIQACGVISVMTNIVPGPIVAMAQNVIQGNQARALELKQALDPLFNLVTVKTTEQTPFGEVVFRARNPLAIKAMMSILGMPSGGCRRPMGKMTVKALQTVFGVLQQVFEKHPEFFAPIEKFFQVNVGERLASFDRWRSLCYEDY